MNTLKNASLKFRSALLTYSGSTNKDMAEIVNQRSLNVLYRMMKIIPPHDAQAKRTAIKIALNEVVKDVHEADKPGPDWVVDKVKKPLIRANLILNRRYGKKGSPGLYGNEMAMRSARFIGRAQKSVGYMKAMLIPAMKRLNAVSRFKRPWWSEHVAIWPNSAASSTQVIANPNSAKFSVAITAPTKKDTGRAQALMESAFVRSMSDEADEMIAHVGRKLSEQARKQGMKVTGRL